MKIIIIRSLFFSLVCLLLPLFFSSANAAVQIPQLLNATKPFWQLNATKMLFKNEAPLAGWSHIAINSSVDVVVFDQNSKRYVFLTDNYENLWSASEHMIKTDPANAFFLHTNASSMFRQIKKTTLNKNKRNEIKSQKKTHLLHQIPSQQQQQQQQQLKQKAQPDFNWIGTSVDPSQCLSPAMTPEACSGNSQQQQQPSGSLLFVSSMYVSHCYFTNPSNPVSLVCQGHPIVGGFQESALITTLNSVAISAAPAGQSKQQSVALVATNSGLYGLWVGADQETFNSRVIVMSTTNGIPSTTSNVTWVGCLPASYYDSNKNSSQFFGSDCFAATNEGAQQNGVQPDLVHNIFATSSTNFGVVKPWSFERIPGFMDARPRAAVYTPYSRRYFMGNNFSVSAMKHTGAFWRYGGFSNGLPAGGILNGAWLDLTSAHQQMKKESGFSSSSSSSSSSFDDFEKDGVVFFGTNRGVIAKIPSDEEVEFEGEGKWKLLLGGRWLPGGNDAAMNRGMFVRNFASGSETVLCSTDTGLSIFFATVWTPAKKANYFETVVAPRHQRSDGLFADVQLAQWGNPATAVKYCTANDGLWTSMRLVSEALRYVASGKTDMQAKENAWTAFRGLQLLINVTGVPGLMGRSAMKTDTSPGHNWVPSPTLPGWYFYATASSDEVTGHFAGYAAFFEWVAETPEEKAQPAMMIRDMMNHIIAGNLTLIDYNGKPSHWGHWDPSDLIDSPFWYDGVPNQLEILSYLSSAYRIVGNESYRDTFNMLVNEYGYDRGIINVKVTQPGDINFSDDELTFMAFLTFYLSSGDLAWNPTPTPNPLFQSVAQHAEEGLFRLFKFIKKGKPVLWAALYCIFQPTLDINSQNTQRHKKTQQEAIQIIWDSMVSSPTDYVNWPVDNSQRLGVVWNPNESRDFQWHVSLENMFPLDELSMFQWNGNPFRAQQGNGVNEASPVGFLFPYYAAIAAPYL